MEAVNDLCSKKADLFASISLLASSVVRSTELGENIVAQIRQKAKSFFWHFLVVDESVDLMSKSQLSVLFVVLIWISILLKNWHPFAACTEQQLEKILS